MLKINKQYLYLLLIISIVMIPNILLVFIGENSIVASNLKKIVYFLFSLSIVLIPLLFLKPKYYSWLSFLLIPFIIFELYNIYIFKTPSSEEAIAAIFYTNSYEGNELIKSNLTYVLIILIIVIIQLYANLKIKKNFKLLTSQKLLLLTFIVLISSAIFIRDYKISSQLEKKASFTKRLNMSSSLFHTKLYKIFPTDVYIKFKNVRKGFRSIKNYNNTISNFKFEATKKDTINQDEIYVFVLGETARKINFGLYNYSRNTTPKLSKQTNLTVFKDVLSSANLTSISIAHLLTRATPNNDAIKLTEPAIINAFKESGFKTYWLTNQAAGLDNVFAFYSRLSDYYKNIAVSIDVAKYDEELLPYFEEILADKSSHKKFIIIHTLGSHFRYDYRYPDKFKKFKPSLSKSISLSGNSIKLKTETINSYDNTIIYTDYILSEIIKKLEKTNSVSFMYYISDHGENLYDDDRELLMHGFTNPTKYETIVPLILWNSSKYMKQYPKKITYLNLRKNSKISSVNTFQTLLDLSNITYKEEDLRQSFINKQFDSLQTRYLLTPDKRVLTLD